MLRRLFRRSKGPSPEAELRVAVDELPQHTRVAMLQALDSDLIIVGAYTDREWGGVCPLLAAHRRGGRPNHATFASAWDVFTNAVGRAPRPAFRSEIRALRRLLEASLLEERERGRVRRALLEEARAARPTAGWNLRAGRTSAPVSGTPAK